MKKTYDPPRPVLNDAARREEAIKRNLPALFEITISPDAGNASGFLDEAWNIDSYGKSVVHEHEKRILRNAQPKSPTKALAVLPKRSACISEKRSKAFIDDKAAQFQLNDLYHDLDHPLFLRGLGFPRFL